MASTPSDSARAPGPNVGLLAVQLGLITQQQLIECLDYQRGEGAALEMEAILVERGLLTKEAIETLLRQYRSAAAPSQAPASPGARNRMTEVKKKLDPPKRATSVQRKSVPPPTPREDGEEDGDAREPKDRSVLVGMLLAFIPLIGLGAYGLYAALAPPAPSPREAAGSPARTGAAAVDRSKAPEKAEEPAEDPSERIRVVLETLPGSDPVATRWNALVDRLNRLPDPEQYKPLIAEMQGLFEEAKGTPHLDAVRDGYARVIEAMNRRGEQVFAYLRQEAARLATAGKFGEAIRMWDEFPGNLDASGRYAREIERLRQETMDTGRRHYGMLRDRAEKLEQEKKYDQAKIVMLEALEIGLSEIVEDAWKSLARISDGEERQKLEEETRQIEEYARRARTEREAAHRIATIRGQFWELVSHRRFESVEPFLRKQREGQPEEVAKEIDELQRAFAELKRAFAGAEAYLQKLVGQEVALTFTEEGHSSVRKLKLKSVADGRIAYTREGKEFTQSLYALSGGELERMAAAQQDGDRRMLTLGAAALLREDFVAAHAALEQSKREGASLFAFVERSTSFLQRNAPLYRERAQRYMDTKEWDKAAQEYSRLVLIPEERMSAFRGRARAYFQLNNFVGTVLDVEQLFELGDFSEEVVRLLTESYQRAALTVKAIQLFESARAKAPENAAILEALLVLYLQIHEYGKARDVLASVKRVQGASPTLAQVIHLLNVASESAFGGQSFKARWNRYDIETNVSQKYANDMAQFMDKVYQNYVKVFPYKKNETLRFHVKIFASEGEFFGYYRKVTGSNPAGSKGKVLAYYMPMTKELVGWDAPDIHETMTHEGLHQYIDYFVSECPIWFNEGYASYFEKSTAEEARFNRERHQTARGLLVGGKLPTLKELMLMDVRTFRVEGAWHYGSSWSAIYFLHKRGQKALLDRYFEELMAGKTQKQAFDAVFGSIDLASLETQWRKAIFDEAY